jgi:uncharacterized protein (DUF58 family)
VSVDLTQPVGAGLQKRVARWWLSRQPLTDTWVLGQRNIYILPTGSGLMFGITLLTLLLASINYQLNLGFVLTFLLAGAAVVSMHMTHGSLRGLTLRLKPPAPTFAGDGAVLEIVISHTGRPRFGIELAEALGEARERRGQTRRGNWFTARQIEHVQRRRERRVSVDVPAASQADAQLMLSMPQRGWHAAPAITVQTRFPFGLFRAWTVWRPAAQILVYPKPEAPPAPLLPATPTPADARSAMRAQGAEPDGVRAWRRGDSMRQIAWKKVARTGELVSRDGHQQARMQLWLDLAGTGLHEREAALSRLTAWVIAADQHDLLYGLRLPGNELAPDHGEPHRAEALRALALCR